MTIQQLRQFCILAEYENITLASKALFITQPALSMVLKNVEKELGLPLFDRKGRNIYLNHLGKDFYNFAKRTLADYDALLEKFRAPHQDSDALHFCYSSAYIPDYVLPAFSADNPNIPITINEVEEKMIPHFLQNEIYDIAISSLKCDTGNQRLISANFFRNKLMVSVPFNNPLASHKLLRIEDLSGQKFFRLSKHGEFSDELDALAKAKGVQMNIAQRVTDSNLNHTGIYLYSKGKIMIHLTFDYKTDEKCTTPGQYLKYHRTFQGLSTRELAEKVGIVPATLVLYENDRHPIKYSTAVALANVLGIDRNRLLDEYTAFVDYPYFSLLKKVRQDLSLTQIQMAELIGIGQTSYSGWEREIRVPRRKEYDKILAALKKLRVNVDTYLCQSASI